MEKERKNIMIVYVFWTYAATMRQLVDRLHKKGLSIDLLCLADYTTIKTSKVKWPLWLSLYLWLTRNIKIHKIRIGLFVLLEKTVGHRTLKRLFHKYDLIDFHSYGTIQDEYIDYCIENKITFDIDLWGTDIIRPGNHLEAMKNGFEHCRFIKGAPNLLRLVSEKFGKMFVDKYRMVLFGNGNFDLIDSIDNATVDELSLKVLGNIQDKTIITIGYNGIKLQQHEKVLSAFGALPITEKNKLFIVIPMTYGGDNDYIQHVENCAKNTQIDYIILKNYLKQDELVAIRKKSDIMIMFQTTDGFAASVQDYLYCNNVVLIGDWLDYPILEGSDVKYLRIQEAELYDRLLDVVSNFGKYKNDFKDNSMSMRNLTSWDAVTIRWFSSYVE